jgi:hypothetical protein
MMCLLSCLIVESNAEHGIRPDMFMLMCLLLPSPIAAVEVARVAYLLKDSQTSA